ncbi:MAG: multicopper oxidase domain-containing protein [Cyanobacteria bacterium SBLK]|nr:multicopper oxidase domain-containing protein [Cyanobacteria bacterium SBLK]
MTDDRILHKRVDSTQQSDSAQLETTESQTLDITAEVSTSEAISGGINRRQILTAGASIVAAFALPRFARADAESLLPEPVATLAQVPLPLPPTITIPFGQVFNDPANFNPPTVTPGTSHLTLNMEPVQVNLVSQAGGTPTPYGNFRAYSHDSTPVAIPGPTFMVQDGQTLDITLNNNLPANPNNGTIPPQPNNDPFCGVSGLPNRPKCFNTGNIHFHGFHVSPSSQPDGTASDDVFVNLQPGQSQEYEVALPTNHAPGTHWYHPHHHGSTGAEVSNSLAGAIIIQEKSGQTVYPGQLDPETYPDAGTATDWIWVMQELTGNANTGTEDISLYTTPGGTAGTFIVNGQNQPQLNLKTGTVHRFRFINATSTPRGFMTLKLQQTADSAGNPISPVERSMYQVAIDGITFYNAKPDKVKSTSPVPFVLAPGNRTDFIVRLSIPGTYQVVKQAAGGPGGSQTLATIVVGSTGAGGNAVPALTFKAWTQQTISPVGMPRYLCPIQPSEIVSVQPPIAFNTIKNSGGGPVNLGNGNSNALFEMDGGRYLERANPQPPVTGPNIQNQPPQPIVNTTQLWILQNTQNGGGGGIAHPFHIHVNPFQVAGVTDSANNPAPNRWFDVYPVPVGGNLPILHRFDDYIGKYVMHCHILIHEDMGMMQDVIVVDSTPSSGVGPGEPLTLPLGCPRPSTSGFSGSKNGKKKNKNKSRKRRRQQRD